MTAAALELLTRKRGALPSAALIEDVPPPEPRKRPKNKRPPRLRCCGRFCYWSVPLGPWRCAVCNKGFWYDQIGEAALVPDNAVDRFFEAIDDLIARIDALETRDRIRADAAYRRHCQSTWPAA